MRRIGEEPALAVRPFGSLGCQKQNGGGFEWCDQLNNSFVGRAGPFPRRDANHYRRSRSPPSRLCNCKPPSRLSKSVRCTSACPPGWQQTSLEEAENIHLLGRFSASSDFFKLVLDVVVAAVQLTLPLRFF